MVVNDGLRYFVGDVLTGQILADLPTSDDKFGIRLNDAGTISATVPAYTREAQALDLRNVTAPVRCFLGASYGEHVLECGPIWARDFDADTGDLDLSAAGIWSILDRRKAVPGAGLVPGAAVTKLAIKIGARALGSIARELVRVSLEDNPYGGELPIVLPPFAAGAHVRNYYGYELGWVGERLRQLTGVQGGPDIRLQPRFRAGDENWIEWVMQTGTDTRPLLSQTGDDWVWDAAAGESGVATLSVSEDATALAAKAWVPGSGQDVKMKLASALDTSLVDQGYPWTEVDVASKDEESVAVLQSAANRLLDDSLSPWETWSLTVRADTDPALGEYLPGHWAVIHVPVNHPILPDGPRRVRILSVDGGSDGKVRLGLGPVQTAGDGTGESITTTRPSPDLLYPAPNLYPSETLYPLGEQSEFTELD